LRRGCSSVAHSFWFRGRVSPRRATHFLCFAKESKQRKATPNVCVPPLRCGQPAVLDSGGGPQNSLRSNSCGPDPASICAPRRIQKGWERAAFALARPQYQQPIPTTNANHRGAQRRGGLVAERSKGPSVSKPLCMRRGAERFADQGRSCLSAASSAEPAKREHRRLPRSEAQGSQTVGSPFFCLRFFGEAKKSRSPAGARPGLGKQTRANDRKTCRVQKPRALTPTLSQGERE
jgi:hypothetical protein